MAATPENKDLVWKTFLWAIAIFISLNISVIGFTITQVHKNDVRISTIESNRFTAIDAFGLLNSIKGLETEIARLPTEVPPKWLLRRVEKAEERINAIENHYWNRKPTPRTKSP